LLCRSR